MAKLGRPETYQRRLEIFARADRFAGSPPAIHAKSRLAVTRAKQLQLLQIQINEYRQEIRRLFAQHNDAGLFESLPGAGDKIAPRLLGEQADKLADDYLRLAEQNASAVIVSQTWGEVHRVNSRVRDALKGKGLLGATDSVVQALERIDLTNAQKRDERFYPTDAIIVFNQKVRDAEPGAKGKLAGILKSSVLVEVGGKFVTVSNRLLDRLTICQTRELFVANGDRLNLKANRKLASGGRVTNGELVTVKSVRADSGVELTDGRVLDKSFREFLPGYAVTSYGSQGKTVDYVLFSDSTIKPATNAQQWYVTISRGRRGIRIFTPDKQQLRENVTRPGHRPLAMEFATGFVPRRNNRLSQQPQSGLLRPQSRLPLREGFMKPDPKTVLFNLAILTLGSCVTQSSPVALQPSCCVKAETPTAFTDKSIYQTESTWTTDQGKHIKLSALAERPQVIAMFFANCQFACPIIVNDMKRIEAALPAQLQGSVGFTLVSFDSERDTPAVLAEYRRTQNLPRKSWTLMQGHPADVLELAVLLGVKFKEDAAGQFAHSNLITILNGRGEIVHQQAGLNQDIQETVRLLQHLVKTDQN